jgi:hypothetical protein
MALSPYALLLDLGATTVYKARARTPKFIANLALQVIPPGGEIFDLMTW